MREPMGVGDLELADKILPPETTHRRARLLVRLHGAPLGEVDVDAGPDASVEAILAVVMSQLGEQVNAHLVEDGRTPVEQLPEVGLGPSGRAPACHAERTAGGVPSVSVVIATRDRPDMLARCLGSLAELDFPAFDVVVVDSAPTTEHTAQLVADQRWPFPLAYHRVDRPGLAIAHNAAIPLVTGEVAAFTDDDVVVDRDWLWGLALPFAEPRVGCVTGLIVPAELDTMAQVAFEQAGGFSRGMERRVHGADLPHDDPLFPFAAGRFGSGANMAFRTSWLRREGGFDPAVGTGTPARGGDDLLAFLRVLLDGHHLVYEPRAIIRHSHRRDFDGLRRQMFGYGVGLGAYLTAAVHQRPELLRPMLRQSVAGARHVLSPSSVKNAAKPEDFPRDLTRRERLGMLLGPFAYARSVRWAGR